ncbi:hypothetical protein LOD99_5372 [Oopsacas minuta]|uniref:Uncharacterized protein n=1 Tax=Oopsacas minuta TaxID=111878 RepID=A0AAV7JR03_9METZ|nr:hypothetical protein LOD99_5372 [Oopsacas minuta]
MASNESISSCKNHILKEQGDFSESSQFSVSEDISYISSPPVMNIRGKVVSRGGPLVTTLPLCPRQSESTSLTAVRQTSPGIPKHSPHLDCLIQHLKIKVLFI